MIQKEYCEEVAKVLGIKSEIKVVGLHIDTNNHLKQRVILQITPTERQAKKIMALARDHFCSET